MTVQDLMTPLTIDEAKSSIYGLLEALGVSTTGWKPGAVVRAIVAVMAVLCVACSQMIVLIAKSAYRSTATGNWLRLHATDFYGVILRGETFATGLLTLVNTGGNVFNAAPYQYKFQNPTTKKTYQNSAAFYLGGGTVGSPTILPIPIIAVEAGSASTSLPGAITEKVTPMNGVSVSNSAIVIGRDAETDAEIAALEDESIDSLSPCGALGAYLAAAKKAVRADGTNIGVSRVRVSPPSAIGVVTVTVATPSGGVSGTVGNPGDDLDYVNNSIQQLATPHGVTVVVQSATTKAMNIVYTAYVYSSDNRSEDDIEDAMDDALSTWVAERPVGGDPGGYIYHSAIGAEIRNGAETDAGNYCYRVLLTTPSSDFSLLTSEVAAISSINGTAVKVDP